MSQQAKDRLSPDAILVPAPEFVLIPVEEGYILDGGRQPEMLSGPFALSTLPVILPLIDGIRSLAEVAAAVPQGARSGVEEAVEQLLSWGVLCLREGLLARPPQTRNTLLLFKRGEAGASLEKAMSALAGTEITILCDERCQESGHEIAEALERNGFSQVQLHSGTVLPNARREAFVISVVSKVSPSSATGEHYARVLSTGCRWLRVNVGIEAGEIGPVFASDTKLCSACLTEQQSGEGLTDRSDLCRFDQAAWSAIVAGEVTALLLAPSPNPRAFRRYRPPFFASEVRTWPTQGLCIHGKGESDGHRTVTLPLLYEEAIASRQEISDAGAGSPSTTPPASTKKMLNNASFSLPTMKLDLPQRVLSLLLSKQANGGTPLTLETVTQLLALSVGVKTAAGDEIRRWAPSGGNLGSAEAYLIAADVKGLVPGAYLYKSEEHTLKRLNQRSTDHVKAACAAVHSGRSAAAMIVLVGAYRRIGRKYGPFAYKLAHLDAGGASSQLLLTASALGVDIQSAQSWEPKRLADALLLRSREEAITHVFCLSSRRSAPANTQEPDAEAKTKKLPKASEPLDPSDLLPEALMEALADHDSFVESRLPDRIGPSKSLSLDHLHASLLAKARSQVTLGAALNKRSSLRAFSGSGVELADIDLLLRTALNNNVFDSSRLSVTVLVQRSATCEPGVYRFEPRAKRLVKHRQAFSREQVEQLFLTNDYGDTSLIFWIGGCVFSTAEPGAERGEYQTLLVRAGLLGHRLWMAALGLGLEGALIAGIRSGAASRSEQFMEGGEVSLLAFLCGYPKRTEAGKEQIA